MTLNPALNDGVFDAAALDAMPAVVETEHFRRVTFPDDLFVFVDGQNNRGIVRRGAPQSE